MEKIKGGVTAAKGFKAAATAAGSPRPRSGSRRLEMLMRSDRERQILPELRHKEARTRSGGRLEMQMRRNCHGQILPRVRLAEACRHRRLAVLLRHGQQGQILLELRR